MNTIKSVIYAVFVMLVALFSSCSGNSSQKSAVHAEKEAKVYDVDELLTVSSSLVGDTVRVSGVWTHICQHGGKKLFLMGSDDNHTLRVEADGKIGQFKPDVVNSIVVVSGVLEEERIDEAYLNAWEEELAAEAQEHGNPGEGGCATEKKARNEEATSSTDERIAKFRERIALRNAEEGKNYLSFYHVVATNYEVQ